MGVRSGSMTIVEKEHVLITGGAGYVGSLLTGVLLSHGYRVTVLDELLFGGESLLGYWHHPDFRFVHGDVTQRGIDSHFDGVDAVVHLAALVGFRACQDVGQEVAWRYNVDATRRVFGSACARHVRRFVFASTYSNYGLAADGAPVNEESPLHPQSFYAETKIAAEEFLLDEAARSSCAPLVFRLATLFGISPRTRFDLIVNQFVLEAVTKGALVIFQRGYSRSFVHVRDVAEGIRLGLEAPEEKVRGQVFNLGSDDGNYTKDEIVGLVQQQVPDLSVRYEDLSFDGDMRDIAVSFAKIARDLQFRPRISVEEGVVELRDALRMGLIKDASESRYRNTTSILP
jgi:nucleoside-diphosphate-sugar epimerase